MYQKEQQDQNCKGCAHRMEQDISFFPFSMNCHQCSRNIVIPAKDYFEQIQTFKVNEYITLKLRGNQTVIYVNNYQFHNCKYLLFNLDSDQLENYDEINSIDDAAELLDKSGETPYKARKIITPLEEFWGHCSNLQAWNEHDYDTRLLHRNLAFPLLRELVGAGDPRASKVFKDEIALRISEGNESVINYLHHQGYLDHFTGEELKTLANDMQDPFIHFIFKNHDLLKKKGATIQVYLKNISFPKDGTICFRDHDKFRELFSFGKERSELHPLSSIFRTKHASINFISLASGYYREEHEVMDFNIVFEDVRFFLRVSALCLIFTLFKDIEEWILSIPHVKGRSFSLYNVKRRIWFQVQDFTMDESEFKKYQNKKNRLLKQARYRAEKYNFNYKITIPHEMRRE